jgi:hypothetical protein
MAETKDVLGLHYTPVLLECGVWSQDGGVGSASYLGQVT